MLFQKKSFDENNRYRLRSCVWEITLACCFSCRHCGSRAGRARTDELSTEDCLTIAAQLGEMGCRKVSLIGGEVFMRRDWMTIAEALTSRKIRVSIITNGFLFSDSVINEIRNAGVESVAISLDGLREIHDCFRQAGSFDRAMQAIDILSENNIPVSVISTLHSRNVSSLGDMYEILMEKHIFAWQLQACSPMGNAHTAGISTKIDFSDVIRFVEGHVGKQSFYIGVADNIGYFTEAEGRLRGNPSGLACFSGCRAGLRSIGIDSRGNVRGCESMYDDRFIEGNLREKTLYEIWTDPNAFAYNRRFTVDKLEGKCSDCAYGARCAGGCRSYNSYEVTFCQEQINKFFYPWPSHRFSL